MSADVKKEKLFPWLDKAMFNISYEAEISLIFLADSCLSASFEAGLSLCFYPEEMAEGSRKSSLAARNSWFLGRLAAKAAAAQYFDVFPAEIMILKGASGQPQLIRPQNKASFEMPKVLRGGVYLSISHTKGGAVAAVGSKPLGVDLERSDRIIKESVRAWAFSETELALVGALGGEKYSGELAFWCAREAAAKAWGRGLLNHLAHVRVVDCAKSPEKSVKVAWLGEPPEKPLAVRLLDVDDFLVAIATC